MASEDIAPPLSCVSTPPSRKTAICAPVPGRRLAEVCGEVYPIGAFETHNEEPLMAEATRNNQERIIANERKILRNQDRLVRILDNQNRILRDLQAMLKNQKKILANQSRILAK
jgi:hypothetical protein